MRTITRMLSERELKKIGEKRNWGNVLDVGSPNKKYASIFRHKSWTTLDLSKTADLQHNIEEPLYSIICYDTLLCTWLLEHLREPRKALINMRRLLKTNGKLILVIPFYYHIHDTQYGDFNRWTKQGILNEVEKAGYRMNKITTLGNELTSIWQTFLWHNFPPLTLLTPLIYYLFGYISPNAKMHNGYLVIAQK